jgi:hypothetical protein
VTWTPALLAAGDVLTAEEVNTLLSGPYWLLSASSDQNISNATATPASFNTVTEYNSRYSTISTPATSVTVPIAGVWEVIGQATFAANSTGQREAYLSMGGSTVAGIDQPANGSRAWAGQVCARKKLAASDTIALYVWQNSTATLATSSATFGGCRLWVKWQGLG